MDDFSKVTSPADINLSQHSAPRERSAPPVKLPKNKRPIKLTGSALLVVIAGIGFLLILAIAFLRGWVNFGDAGPTEVATYERQTEIKPVEFVPHAAVTSVFPVSAYDPGWEACLFGACIGGGQAYLFMDVVGDLELGINPGDQTIHPPDASGVIRVDVNRIVSHRPRVDHNPRVINGVTYQTGELSTLSRDKIADSNLDRAIVEGISNFFDGDDQSYIDELTDVIEKFGQAELSNSECFDEALPVIQQGVERTYTQIARGLGVDFTRVEVNIAPDAMQPESTPFELVDTEIDLNREASEQCFVVDDWAEQAA